MTLPDSGSQVDGRATARPGQATHRLRLATWNVNSIGARMPRLLEWLARIGPDLVCLQRIWSVYAPNGRALDSPHFAYKLAWLQALADAVRGELAGGRWLALCGDFNVAPTDADVWDPAALAGATHVSPAEREALNGLLACGLTDIHPRALKGAPLTYWDYRAGMFHRGFGMRIDPVLAADQLTSAVQDAYIDRDARKGPRPSDHAPVVVEIKTD